MHNCNEKLFSIFHEIFAWDFELHHKYKHCTSFEVDTLLESKLHAQQKHWLVELFLSNNVYISVSKGLAEPGLSNGEREDRSWQYHAWTWICEDCKVFLRQVGLKFSSQNFIRTLFWKIKSPEMDCLKQL